MQHDFKYTIIFAALLSLVCAIMVAGSAVSLKPKQEINAALDKKRNVLEAAGMVGAGVKVSREEIERLFATVEPVLVDMKTGEEQPDGDVEGYDALKRRKDPELGMDAPTNRSRVLNMPKQGLVYKVKDEAGQVEKVVLPIEGYGLWGTLYGFMALEKDANTVVGLTFYTHKETPGLGGEVDNPKWKGLWPGRKIFDGAGAVGIEVIKGAAGPVEKAPYRIDGLSGATITSRGVTNMLEFWLGPDGFGPYLDRFRAQQAQRLAPSEPSEEIDPSSNSTERSAA